jgi:scyllo-inositol 2-dehydrogenase (NAD+)
MTETLGVGVVGVGVLGRRHAENLAWRIAGARLVAVADARPEVARSVAEELGAARWFGSAEELAADSDVEALVIASADEAHAAGILAAARQGKDVFCEKPITTTLADADAALAAVAEAGVRLQIGFMRRYDPAYLAAKRQIEEGRIGTPVFFKNAHRGKDPLPGPVRPAAAGLDPAAFVNSNIHDYDNARWLLGDKVAAVHAVAARVTAPDAPELGVDTALTTLHFAGGGLGNVENVNAVRYAYDVRTEVVGARGTVFIGSLRQTGCVLATEEGVSHDAPDHWLTRFGETYLIELEDWVRRTLAGEPPAVTGNDGRAALEISLAAVRSFHEGRTISLP